MERRARELKVSDQLIWLNNVKDMSIVYSGTDVLLMPSKYEGLPLSLVEAQASGLLCIVSDSISEEVYLTDLITPTSISAPAGSWLAPIRKIIEIPFPGSPVSNCREEYSHKVRESGYDIRDQATLLESIYEDELHQV